MSNGSRFSVARLLVLLVAPAVAVSMLSAVTPATAAVHHAAPAKVLVLAKPVNVVATRTVHGKHVGVLRVAGRVTPVRAGRVVLQRRTGSHWADVAKGALGKRATFGLVDSSLPFGRSVLRVVEARSGASAQAVSASFAVTVVMPTVVAPLPLPPAPVPPSPPTTAPVTPPAAGPPTLPVDPPVAVQCTGFLPAPAAPTQLALSLVTDPDGYVGEGFFATVDITGGTAGYAVTAASALPMGLSIVGGPYGETYIAGVPTTAGVYHVALHVIDASGRSTTGTICLQVAEPLIVTTSTLPPATVGQAYDAPIEVHGGYLPIALQTFGPRQTAQSMYASGTAIVGTPVSADIASLPLLVSDGIGSVRVDWATLTVGPLPAPRTLHVPGDAATISAAIAAAQPGDTVVVGPGTYHENVDFGGKGVAVRSSDGPTRTVIDGGGHGPTVTFADEEPSTAVLQGFTIRGGSGSLEGIIGSVSGLAGGGVFVEGASPTVIGNLITANNAPLGSGVFVEGGAPVFTGNTVTANASLFAPGGQAEGAGFLVTGATQARIVNNTVTDNNGTGVLVDTAQQVETQGNVVSGNLGGLEVRKAEQFSSVDDVFAHDRAQVTVLVGNYYAGAATLANDTIADNAGTGLSLGWTVSVVNTVIDDETKAAPLQCSADVGLLPIFHDNLVHTAYPLLNPATDCQRADPTESSAAPQFVDAAHDDFTPAAGSPLVDAGAGFPLLPATDAAGNPRVVGSVDIGAYERQ
ncbi:hypothetical protein acdb102_27370 [Acidothermaceae bacterium B102]|nr:hypothetical protein acdb102_27370 [Acidothermaceae bacterium B102]